MQHRLVPDFVLEQAKRGRNNGRLFGTAMFLDVSGFSSMMDVLMRHGEHGSEVMATLMRQLFDPLVTAVYAHRGYIIGFAGDAFTAVFSDPTDAPMQTPHAALAAALAIQTRLKTHHQYQTEYGAFQIGAKIGLAYGAVEWGLLEAEEGHRATYFFKGDAIQGCADAEHAAVQGEIVLHDSIMRLIADSVQTKEKEGCFVVTAAAPLSPPTITPTPALQDAEILSKFFPKALIIQTIPGEFRQIINLFISLEGTPSFEALQSFMQTVFLLQDRYGGLLNRVDFGDKGCHMLFFWGAPTSFEHDLTNVISFVQDLRDRTSWPLRSGITYRIAHAGFIGSDLHEEYTCYGRGVNLAARFMTHATYGETWVDEEIAERARTLFRFEFIDTMTFKGFAEPQSVYRLLGRRLMAQTPFYQGKLVGREHELAQLETFAQPLLDGRFPGVATVIGEAGIGKSRLVHEFLETNDLFAEADHFLCQADEISRQSLHAVRYWLRHYFEQNSAAPEEENKRSFSRIFAHLVEETENEALITELTRASSFIGALLGLKWPDSLYEQVEPQLRYENSLAGLKALLKAEARRQPVVLHLEDAQWVDDDTLHFIRRLTHNIAHIPLLILITSRLPLPEDALEPGVPRLSINLDNLSDDATLALITNQLGETPDRHFLDWLMERTNGNPFFLEQILLYLEENDLLRHSTEQFTTYSNTALLPTDVRSVLTARLDRLSEAVREVVQTAAVVGREFDALIVQHMLENQPEVSRFLQTAADEAIWMMLSQVRYLFRHMLLREAAYNMQVQSLLKDKHRRAASAFEALYEADLTPYYGQIAYHYDQASVLVKAVNYYERSADRARENFYNEDALAQYNRALTLLEPDNTEAHVRLLLGKEEILNWLGRREEQKGVLDRLDALLQTAPRLTHRHEVLLRRAALATNTGHFKEAIEAAQQALETAVSTQNKIAEVRANHRIGRTYWQHNEYAKAKPFIEKALAIAVAEAERSHEADCLYDLAAIEYLEAKTDDSLDKLNKASALFETLNYKPGIIRCLNLSGLLYEKLGAYSRAREENERALQLCNQIGWKYGAARVTLGIGNIFLITGNYPLARSNHQQAEAICRELNDKEGLSNTLDSQGLSLFFMNQYETAVRLFEQAIAVAEEANIRRSISFASYHLGYCLVELGRYSEAKSALNRSAKLRRELDGSKNQAELVIAKAKLSLVLGDHDGAVHYIQRIADELCNGEISGIEFPVLVYLDAYDLLRQTGQEKLKHLANALLKTGYRQLMDDAQKIQNLSEQEQFFNNVPYNRKLLQRYRSLPSTS